MTTTIKIECGDCGAEFTIERTIDAHSTPAPDEQPTYCPFCSSTMIGDFEQQEQPAGRTFLLTASRNGNPFWLDIDGLDEAKNERINNVGSIMLNHAWRITHPVRRLGSVVTALKSLRAKFPLNGQTAQELEAILETATGSNWLGGDKSPAPDELKDALGYERGEE